MTEDKWEVLDTVSGSMTAELLRGMLEAQEIDVVLSQEGAGRSVIAVSVGPLSEVQILVPSKDIERARILLDEYYKEPREDSESQVLNNDEGQENNH